ncbi:MAG: hypothetical protein HY791_10575 [Deltaproteobacteria bacterium]|nr:hypothetical protein [Deltaproteobacteria bacterium]
MFERIVCLKLVQDEGAASRAIQAARTAFPDAWVGRPFDDKSKSSWDLCIRLRSESRAHAEDVLGSGAWAKLTAELGTSVAVLKTWGFEEVEGNS